MRLDDFLFRLKYWTATKPDDVSVCRWLGMLAWFAARIRDNDLELED